MQQLLEFMWNLLEVAIICVKWLVNYSIVVNWNEACHHTKLNKL